MDEEKLKICYNRHLCNNADEILIKLLIFNYLDSINIFAYDI